MGVYLALMDDRYPSTDEEQSVHLDFAYPDAQVDLNRWLPSVKWFLAIPYFILLFFLYVGVVFAAIGAWFAILFTGRYPKSIFDYIEGGDPLAQPRGRLRADIGHRLLPSVCAESVS